MRRSSKVLPFWLLLATVGCSSRAIEGPADTLLAEGNRLYRAKEMGRVGEHPAGRIDGEFNNGTHFATRDYIVCASSMVIKLMVRGPASHADAVFSVADRLAASFSNTH